VFICDNLAFRSDLMVRRTHSPQGIANFSNDIATAVLELASFRDTVMPDERADSLILRAAIDRGVIPLRAIPHVVREWKEPRHEQFAPRTAWSLFNAFTSAFATLQEPNPAELARWTMRLSAMLSPTPAKLQALAV